MVILLPRLPVPAAEALLEQYTSDDFDSWSGFDPHDLPEAVRFAATGGSQVSPGQLGALRDGILTISLSNGFGGPRDRASFAKFDAQMAASLAEEPLFQSGEALRDDVWTFIGTSLAPDVVRWRFGVSRERYVGGVRNTFQRLWMRGHALDRGRGHQERWQLLEELTEDALVQITERPSLGGDSILARAIAEAWLRASLRHGKGAMEPIMRRAALRVRIWNEIRSLADLPSEHLADILDDAFDLRRERDTTATSEVGRKNGSARQTEGVGGCEEDHSDSQRAPSSLSPTDLNDAVGLAVVHIRREAMNRRWISPKSSNALDVVEQRERELTASERNSLNYLLSRIRSAGLLQEDVSRIVRAITC